MRYVDWKTTVKLISSDWMDEINKLLYTEIDIFVARTMHGLERTTTEKCMRFLTGWQVVSSLWLYWLLQTKSLLLKAVIPLVPLKLTHDRKSRFWNPRSTLHSNCRKFHRDKPNRIIHHKGCKAFTFTHFLT